MTNDYKYAVFLSHSRNPSLRFWLRKVKEILEVNVTDEMGGTRQEFFLDEQSIPSGSLWDESIKSALTRSRCLVSIWRPSYFTSPWCRREWKSFILRQELFSGRLILPIWVKDGEHFPPEALRYQMFDARKFHQQLAAFWRTSRAVRFERELQRFSVELAAALRSAPEFNPEFPICLEEEISPGPVPRQALPLYFKD